MASDEYDWLCESCGGGFNGLPIDDHTCRGCGLIVCDSCTMVFEHAGNGKHGSGNPSAQIVADRDKARLAEEMVEIVREHASCYGWLQDRSARDLLTRWDALTGESYAD